MHIKGFDGSSTEDKEKYMYKPTFKPLWRTQVCSVVVLRDVATLRQRAAACVCCPAVSLLQLLQLLQLSVPVVLHQCAHFHCMAVIAYTVKPWYCLLPGEPCTDGSWT